MYPSIHLIYIYLSMYSIYVSIHPSLPIYLTITSSIHPSIHRPGITSSQESLFNTSFQFLQHLTSEMSTYTDENTLRYVNLFCTTVRTHVLYHLTYSCSVLLYVHMYFRAYIDPVSSLLGFLRVLAAVVKVSWVDVVEWSGVGWMWIIVLFETNIVAMLADGVPS